MNLDPHKMFATATSTATTTTMLAKSSPSATTTTTTMRRLKRCRRSTTTPESSNSNDNASVRSSTEYNYASERLHGSCEKFRVDHLTSVPATMDEETNMPFTKTTRHHHREHKTRLNHTTTSSNTRHTAATRSTRLFPLLNYDRRRHHSMLAAIFIVILQLTSTVLSSQETSNSNKTTPGGTMASTTMAATSTTALPTMSVQAMLATNNENNNNNNMGDIKVRQQMSTTSEQQPAIEQVAKAEALTAASPANQQQHHHHHHHHQQQHQPQPVAAALQQQPSNVNLFEVCKVQTLINQHLTNLSHIVFQPSDICSNWHKMSRSDPPPPQATAAATIMANSESNPWYYIEQLNLSENNLTVLHDSSGLSRLINLFELKITHNQLSRCEEASLFGLQKLQSLDLSHNKLMALPAKFFQPVKQTIKKLNLSFNSISVLVPTLFDSLNQLEHLDLSHNDITSHWINDRLFKNLTQLRYLDLSFNKLTVFSSPMTFSSLQQLETLSLQHNELRQVPETIQHLRYLSSLDLSQNLIHDITNASYLSNCRFLFNLNLESNNLENITRDAFSDMPALKVLNLANNRIHHLDQQAFEYVPDLHALRLDSNRLVDFGQAFMNLRFLLMLNISSNRISSFDYAQIPLGLQWLDLHSNKIDKLNNFYYSPSAQQLSASNDILSSSQQASIGQQWKSLLRLTTLDVSFNLIRELDNTSLPESLETVQLNNNHIKTIASQTFSTKSNLTRINLSHNQLTTLPFDALKLNNNRDSSPQLQQQKFVDVYLANNPFVCNCNMGWFSQLLLASSNPFQGGAIPAGAASRDHTFLSIYSQMIARQLPRVADAALVNCHLPFGRPTTYTADPHQWSPVSAANQLALQQNHHALAVYEQPLILRQSELLQSVHLCPYKSHCFALCYCCDFDACDCEMSCPENCSCYYDQTWSTNIVDCSANNQINGNSQTRFTQMMMGAGQSGHHYNTHHHHHQRQPSSAGQQQQQQQQVPQMVRFKTIPEKIPMDVTDLFLDGLELLQLQSNALIGRKNLKSLYLNNSQLYSIEPKALATQKSLRVLQLNSNQLTTLMGYEFEQQVELRELYLANNRLTSIANATFTPLKSLQILHLQNNHLYHFNLWSNMPTPPPPALAGQHKSLISINLGSNPWSCQCDHIEPMLQWLQVNIKYIYDRKSVSCQYDQATALHLISPLASENSLSASIYGSNDENYPMFDKKLCLNYTVYPVQNGGNGQPLLSSSSSSSPPSTSQYGHNQQPATDDILIPGLDSTNMPPFRPTEPQPDEQPLNPGYHQLPNDEPPRIGGEFNGPSMRGYDDRSSLSDAQPHNGAGIQYPPGVQSSRASIMTPSLLIGSGLMLIILIVVVLSLIHYRRSMGMWFYSNYGLNMFSASKSSHKHSVNSLGKHQHHHHPHLSHQYGVSSSAGSTSSSSAASSNLSQALCQQQQQHQSSSGASTGLVTTPLIVTNNQAMTMNATTTTAPYQDEDRLFDAYLTYSKFDEQFVNDYIAPELECSPPSYRVALHYRDLPVTTSEFLNDCIIETANASRRVIMVVSEQFLRTEWMQYEFRSAHLEALKGNYRQRLIIIMLGQPSSLTTADLDPDMLQWLKSCTCIQWGEKMFWQRLRFALPDMGFARGTPSSAASGQPNAYLRYQTLAPHQQQQMQTLQQQQQHFSQQQPAAGAKSKRNNLGANLLRSATGLLSGHHNSPLPPPSHQQLITSNVLQHHNHHNHHPSLGRPLPQPGGGMVAHFAGQMKQPQAHHLAEEHHYAHLTPATMIQQQQQQSGPGGEHHAYHQPIYGDPSQQVQAQQQQQQRDNPVHI